MYGDGETFFIGVFIGFVVASLLWLAVFHNVEGWCEWKYNVYDCQLKDEPFEPTPPEL